MEVKQVSNQSFTAVAKIKAPEALLSKDNVKKIEAVCKKIGTSKDVISVALGNLYESKHKKGVMLYDMKMVSKIGTNRETFQLSIPIEKYKPIEYILKRLSFMKGKK